MRLLLALLVALTGCYIDRVQTVVVTQVKWHRAPVACLDPHGSPPPTPPEDHWCASDPSCEAELSLKWAEYGRAAWLFIHLQVEPVCYEAAGRAGGPQ